MSGGVLYTGILPGGGVDTVRIPLAMDFLGRDSLFVATALGGDANRLNDTLKHHIEVYDESTKVGSNFNAISFPPNNGTASPTAMTPDIWWSTILVGTHNWARWTTGTNPSCMPLEGYGMAGYPSYFAARGSCARLRTHRINIGPGSCKLMLCFYMYQDPGYPERPDSMIVEFSYNDTIYHPVAAFCRYHPTARWYVKNVEIGNFPANANLYIGFQARSKWGNNIFIDSVWVFATTPTAFVNDAGLTAIFPLKKPVVVNDSSEVKIIIKNFGLNTLTSLPIFFTTGGSDTTWETWSGQLMSNESAVYTFTQPFIPALPG